MTLNFKQFLKKRHLSWSAISSFEYSPEQWYSKYILGIKDPENASMKFGRWFGERLATDPTFYPQIPRYPVFEKKLSVVFNKISIIGFMDSYDPATHSFIEYKTSKTLWSTQKAQDHGQLHLYALALFITHKVRPEDLNINLVCVKTKESGDFDISIAEPFEMVNYSVKLTMSDLLLFGSKILRIVGEMEEFVKEKEV